MEDNAETHVNAEDQPPDPTDPNPNAEETPLELPENMNLDGNEQAEETNEENTDENNPLEIEEQPDSPSEEDPQADDDNDEANPMDSKTKEMYDLPEDLPDQEQEQLEQSALTDDKTPNIDSSQLDQMNESQKNFANAETFEDQKTKEQQTIGESSSKKKTSQQQQQQISSNKTNQLTQQLNSESQPKPKSSNESNEQRTLSEIASLIDKNISAAFDLEQTEDEQIDDLPGLDPTDDQQTRIYAHAKNIPQDLSQQKQILDSATDEQSKRVDEQEDLQSAQPEPMIIDNQEDEPNKSQMSTLEKEPMKKPANSSSSQREKLSADAEVKEENEMINIDKPFIGTSTVDNQVDYRAEVKPVTNQLTEQIEYQLEEWYTNRNDDEHQVIDAEQLWTQLEYLTQPYVFELCEQLRLLLEPTQRTKYSGDYRTGKRLNMKRIIPYIASDFRKDRIWLRRSKPSKRQYQLILAIDDSQSMDNLQVKRLALESLILLGQTLTLLDIGQFGIVSFGQFIRTLQPLNQTFNHEQGIEILKQLQFDQTKTLLAEVSCALRCS